MFSASVLADTGNWMVGLDVSAGVLAPASMLLGYAARVDRYLWSAGDAAYVGATFGHLSESDGEDYGGDGPFAGAQVGYMLGRERQWLRAAVEAQVSFPLFGEKPNKPGDYVYPFITFGLRLFL
ncbi:MAG TPA: hypothetical protein VMK66_09240 [Myxococcales bacterium]|nr:hypothetical protein [Myxococcales bacterium]